MAKRESTTMENDFEHPLVEEESTRRVGLLTALVLVSILGAIIWFIYASGDST